MMPKGGPFHLRLDQTIPLASSHACLSRLNAT
jgi:hypothetical protein